MVFKLGLFLAVCLSVALAKPSCPCPQLDEPVCGSDGNTYQNMCELGCTISQDPDLTLVEDGPCQESESSESGNSKCGCSRESNPVCGSDGITYGNRCALECATNEDPSLVIVSDGPCDESDAARSGRDQICDCSLLELRGDDIDVDELLSCCPVTDLIPKTIA